MNLPPGGSSNPSRVQPQQSRVPFVRIPQVWRKPARDGVGFRLVGVSVPTYYGALETEPGRHRTTVVVVADLLPVGVQVGIVPPVHRQAVTTVVPQPRRVGAASQGRRSKTCSGGQTLNVDRGCHITAPSRPAPPHRICGPVRMRPPSPDTAPRITVINNPSTSATKRRYRTGQRATPQEGVLHPHSHHQTRQHQPCSIQPAFGIGG